MVFIKVSALLYLNFRKIQPLYLANTATKIQLWISINVTTFLHFFSLNKLAIEIHTQGHYFYNFPKKFSHDNSPIYGH